MAIVNPKRVICSNCERPFLRPVGSKVVECDLCLALGPRSLTRKIREGARRQEGGDKK